MPSKYHGLLLMELPQIDNITFEKSPERLKVVLPVQRHWFLFVLFTLCMVVWLVMLVGIAVALLRDVIPARERFTLVLTIILLVWLVLWYLLGKVLWKRWQYYAANREILFLNQERLIVRRPVSILGITDAYDMNFVTPFYYSQKHRCPAFDYGYHHVYFGRSLAEDESKQLIRTLNEHYFPDADIDD